MSEPINLTLTPKDRLLPCPFCGGANLELQNTWTPCYWIECQVCGVQMSDPGFNRKHTPRGHAASKRAAIKAWNRRDGDPLGIGRDMAKTRQALPAASESP